MKNILILIVLTAFGSNLMAQDTLRISLSQSIQLGLSNRFDVKEDSMKIHLAENQIAKSKNELWPDLSASGKVNYNTELQPSIIPAGYLGFTEPQKIAIGMKNNTAFALDLNYTFYKPGLQTDIKIAEKNLALEKEKNRKSVQDIRDGISIAYFDVLLKSLQYDIAQKNEQRYKDYYELTNGKYKNGVLLESDALQAGLDYNNSQSITEKQKQNYLLSMIHLKHEMNVSDQTPMILTDSLRSVETLNTAGEVSIDAANNRSEIKQLLLEKEAFGLQLKKARQNYLPTLSLFANYTQLFQGPGFDYSNQFYWASVNYAGVKLSIPITGSFKNSNNVKEYNLKILQTNFALQQKTSDIIYEIQHASTALSNAENNLQVAKDNYALSQKLYSIKNQQFDLGAFSYESLLDTEKSLSRTEQEYISSVYDFLIAKINYQKAVGRD